MSFFPLRLPSPRLKPHRQGALLRAVGVAAVSVAGLLLAVGPAQAEELAKRDKTFLSHAAEVCHAEIRAGKLAMEKTASPDIKNYASQMVEEHTTLGGDLKKLAVSKNLVVPDEPSLVQRGKIAVLDKLDGETFDKQYISMIGVSVHEDAVKLYRKGATESQDADVKDFAAKTLPGLRQHLEMADALKAKLDAKK